MLRIGTRGSPLALWQAHFVAGLLRSGSALDVELMEIQTAGDQVRDVPLAQIGGEGVFTKEIQRALLERTVDVAVHSLKDLPTVAVEGLVLAAVPPRGPTGDVLVSHKHAGFDRLPTGGRLATSSLRRQAQLRHRRPDLQLCDIRGNVETRLRKMVEQDLDGLVLARAGLERLGLADRIVEILDPAWMLPAVGQGALGLECRADDAPTRAALRQLDDSATHAAVLAERALLRALGGGCQVPIGAAAVIAGDHLMLRAAVLDAKGGRRIERQIDGPPDQAEELGRQLAQDLMARGARALLAN
jgi:hydroxymethylbilane synthase